jgi:tetratricopeptide (TPR) repeat protein
LTAQLKKARKARTAKQFDQCEALCEQVLSVDPGCPEALDMLADCMAARGNFQRAVILLDHLQKTKQDDPIARAAILSRLAEYRREIGSIPVALEDLRVATELDPGHAGHWAKRLAFSFFHEDREDVRAQSEPLLMALENDSRRYPREDFPLIAQGLYLVAQVAPAEAARAWLQRILDLEALPRYAWLTEEYSHQFGVAALYDSLGSFDVAWSRYGKANLLRRKRSRYKLAPQLAQMRKIADSFDSAFFASDVLAEPRPGEPRLIFIVGMPRSGTSLLEQILASHSMVTPLGETHHLAHSLAEVLKQRPDCDPARPETLDASFFTSVRRLYLRAVDAKPGQGILTDKMPANLMYVWLIRKAFPDGAVVVSRRQKLGTVMSCYTTNFANLNAFSENLEDCARYYDESYRVADHWLRELGPIGRDQSYEELVAHPREQIAELLAHAGLDEEEACFAPHLSKRVVETASRLQVTQPIYSTGNERWAPYLPLVENGEQLFPET